MKNWIRFGAACALILLAAQLLAAIGDPLVIDISNDQPNAALVRPISTITQWGVACSDTSATDNSGSTVVNPSLITRSAQHWVQMGQRGTTLEVRFKYPTGATTPVGPVVQIFGRDANLICERLTDSTATHTLSLTTDTTNDVRDSTYSYTQPIEVDCNANAEAIVAIKTAQTGTGMTGAAILVRIK